MKNAAHLLNLIRSLPRSAKAMLPLLVLLLASSARDVTAQGTVVTYQGRLQDNGTNFTGTGLFKFALVTSTNTSHQATATATISGGGVNSVLVTYGGSGYLTAPVIQFNGGGGFGASATATVSGGAITMITVNNTGFGYVSSPTVVIPPPPANVLYTSYWSNDGSSVNGSEPAAAVSVPVTNGLFTVGLGDTSLANMAALPPAVFTQPNLQLRLWFNDGVQGSAALSPVQNVTTTPYAAFAGMATNLLGPLPAGALAGTYPGVVTLNNAANSFSGSGSGLTGLNASQLTSGIVPDAQLSANVPRLNVNQTFTGTNAFPIIKLGNSGQYLAAGGYANLLIVRGIVRPDGTIYNGTGFTVTHNGTGNYTLNFSPAFTDVPALILTAYSGAAPNTANCNAGLSTSYTVSTWSGSAAADIWWNFIAIGAH